LGWGAAAVEAVVGNRRRYGGYLVHIGMVILVFGVIGSKGYQLQGEANLSGGQTMQVGAYTLRYEGLRQYMAPDDREVTEATVGVYKGGDLLKTVKPHRDYFLTNEESSTTAGQMSTPMTDVYVLLAGWENNTATFKVYVNPLVNWVWSGGILLTFGTFLAAWPSLKGQRRWALQPGTPRAEPVAS
jgi:cytochrome c-type biogenesis protein CcmF